jgi:hypothetical protein
MSSQEQAQSGDAQHERFDNPDTGSGVRDTGTDAPEHGRADRPVGTVDEDANPPLSDPTKSDVYGGTGESPPQDTGAAIPPYEGRARSASSAASSTEGSGGANVGGATGPVTDPDYKSESPAATRGGATTSPADEQPASQTSESDRDDDRIGPGHTPGTGRGESKN